MQEGERVEKGRVIIIRKIPLKPGEAIPVRLPGIQVPLKTPKQVPVERPVRVPQTTPVTPMPTRGGTDVGTARHTRD
jgi:hypothetical protein